jgi:ketosteroid isomerase-like protein
MLRRLSRLCAFVAAGAVLLSADIAAASDTTNEARIAGTPVEAQQSGNTHQEISALLDQYTQALLEKDVAALDRIWADDLTFINLRGELLTKQNRLANIKSGATAFKSIRLSDKRIRTYGEVGVATVQVTLEAQYSGQEGSGDHSVTTVWAKPKGTWQLVAVHMTRVVK